MINFNKAQRIAMKIMLKSFIYYLNEKLKDDLTEKEKDKLANTIFNVMTNSLKPVAAIYWNEEIFNIAERGEDKHEVLEEIYSELGWDK